jgi:hypothetical protein
MALYTVCYDCCAELELYDKADQINEIRSFKGGERVSGSMIFGVTYKEIEEMLCSKVVIMEGRSTTSFKTFGEDGKEKQWAQAKLAF